MPSAASALTLPEITAAVLAAPPLAFVQPPAPEQTLRSYVLTVGGGRNIDELMVSLGYAPALADRVTEGLQAMPEEAQRRIAAALGRPLAEVTWACGGRLLLAPAVGLGRRGVGR